jgi:hypothetical protein
MVKNPDSCWCMTATTRILTATSFTYAWLLPTCRKTMEPTQLRVVEHSFQSVDGRHPAKLRTTTKHGHRAGFWGNL